ncbi:MAG: thiamine diphosphokinase [Pseudomonadota bacterium]
MIAQIVETDHPVVLLGAGDFQADILTLSLARAKTLVAADGGANAAIAEGHHPDAVIGDFDSLEESVRTALPPDRFYHIAEQDSTDFEKCLTRISSPLILAVGFTGARLDHTLAVCNALVRHHDRPCVVLGSDDVCFVLPRKLVLNLPTATCVSIFPMAKVRAKSTGLIWPIDDVPFAPDGPIGTSNAASGGRVEIWTEAPGLLGFLPLAFLDQVVGELSPGETAALSRPSR